MLGLMLGIGGGFACCCGTATTVWLLVKAGR